MGIENMPTENLNTPENEEEIIEARKGNDRYFKGQAFWNNETRGPIKKILGIGKVSNIDLAHKEALRVNKLVDKKIKREENKTSAQTSANEILRDPKFGKEDQIIIKLQSARAERGKNVWKGKNIR